jgi:holo-[acyl-carrier protein] synthase
MIVAVGVDTVDIARVARLLAAPGERFVARVFTPGEAAYCRGRAGPAAAASFAARFAAKEAVLKALGTGWAHGIAFRQVEVVRDHRGAVAVHLHAAAATRAQALRIARWHLSLTHTDTSATAFVVAES